MLISATVQRSNLRKFKCGIRKTENGITNELNKVLSTMYTPDEMDEFEFYTNIDDSMHTRWRFDDHEGKEFILEYKKVTGVAKLRRIK